VDVLHQMFVDALYISDAHLHGLCAFDCMPLLRYVYGHAACLLIMAGCTTSFLKKIISQVVIIAFSGKS
jgi:hypothetical protein